jgi:hypothetical protein
MHMRYFYHPESGARWTQDDNETCDWHDELVVELTIEEYTHMLNEGERYGD